MQKVALIGLGFIGANHAQALGNSKKAKLVAIIELDEERGRKAAAEYGAAYYKTPDEAIAKEKIDIAIICLPTYLHEQYVLWAAEHKIHVLCEKPFTLTLESAQRMLDACTKNGVKLMVAQAARWTPEFVRIREMLQEDAFGDIHMIVAKRLGQHPNWSTWHRDPDKSGGGLYDLYIHDLDYLYSLFGKVSNVHAIGWKSPTNCWNHVVTNLTFANGVQCSCEASMEMPDEYPFSVGFRLVGDQGGIDYHFVAGFNIKGDTTSAFTHYQKGGQPKALTAPTWDMYQEEMEAFVDSLETGCPLAVPNSDSLEVIKLVLAIKKSLETKEIVAL